MATWPEIEKLINKQLNETQEPKKPKVRVIDIRLEKPDEDKLLSPYDIEVVREVTNRIKRGEVQTELFLNLPDEMQDFIKNTDTPLEKIIESAQQICFDRFLQFINAVNAIPEVRELYFKDHVEYTKYLALTSLRILRRTSPPQPRK